ncbi:MAG: hypothetical protein KatS3mg105_2422 [Gemmatales bacterium]|nr:MAG: hypothetical protein KatS3mg105_2422 [Gemmatales bacterium]
MAADELLVHDEETPIVQNAWPVLIAALLLCVTGFVVSIVARGSWLWCFPVFGVFAAGLAVYIQPRAPLVLAAAGVSALLAKFTAGNAGWDWSAGLFFGVAAGVALFSAVVLLLPRPAQKVAVSLVILFHFGGILSAVTSAPPPAWVGQQAWTYIFRPYLQFMYFNNAYHFYSPEPGPASLVWFFIEYEEDADGTRYYRWIKVPELDDDGRPIEYGPTGERRRYPYVNYTRRLSLAESINKPSKRAPTPKILEDRVKLADAIPTHPVQRFPLPAQYQEPDLMAKQWLASYARHVARTYRHEAAPHKKVKSVKVYRVTHLILNADQMERVDSNHPDWLLLKNRHFYDPITYLPVFVGEFDVDGNLLSLKREFNLDNGQLAKEERDPLLYWMIPILQDPNKGALGIETEDVADGVRIRKLVPGRAAFRADLRAGDVIYAIRRAGENRTYPWYDVRTTEELRDFIERMRPGEVVELRIRAGDDKHEVFVRLMPRIVDYLKLHAEGDITERNKI